MQDKNLFVERYPSSLEEPFEYRLQNLLKKVQHQHSYNQRNLLTRDGNQK